MPFRNPLILVVILCCLSFLTACGSKDKSASEAGTSASADDASDGGTEGDSGGKAGSNKGETSDTKSGADNAPPAAVVIATVKTKDVPVYGQWTGRTAASQTVDVVARVEGILETASFKEGDFVSKGQTIFTIESKKYHADVMAASAELEKAKATLIRAQQQVELKQQKAELAKNLSNVNRAKIDLTRVRELAKDGAVSAHDLDVSQDTYNQAKAQYEAQVAQVTNTEVYQKSQIAVSKAGVESAEAALEQAQLSLSYTTVKSPLHGIIGKNLVYPGSLVGRGFDRTVLATISAVDPIKVDFNIAEADYLRFSGEGKADKTKRKNGGLELLTADNKIYPYKGTFRIVDRAVNSQTGTIACQCTFPNPKALLRPGQFGRVRAMIEFLPGATLVPEVSVQELQGIKVVFVVDSDGKVEQRTVNVGDKFEKYLVVDSGLKPGERVIVEGIQKARPGKTVSVTVSSDM